MNTGPDIQTAATPLARTRGTLADDVSRMLADQIVLGALLPGARLDEVTLAQQFGVSRTPVREALKQLSITGLVVMRPNRGAAVASLAPQELDSLFEAISELEAACARHAALRMNEVQRSLLRELHQQGRAAMQAHEVHLYDEVNRALHKVLIEGAHNVTLADTVSALRHRAAPFRRTQFRQLERMGESFAEHSAIVEAVLAHDAVAAYREMRNHLLTARAAASRLAPAWSTAPASAAFINTAPPTP